MIYRLILASMLILMVVCQSGAGHTGAFASPEAIITSISMQAGKSATSFNIGLSSPAKFQATAKTNPDRVEIESETALWPQSLPASGIGSGLITVYRQAQTSTGATHIVLETTGPVKVVSSSMGLAAPGQPTVFSFSLTSADESAPPVPEVLPISLSELHEALDPKPTQKGRTVRRVIAVDPGHGGIDPGTASGDGVFEKAITLQSGLALKAALEATGRYTVVMTRDEDRFVPLPDRVKLARAAGAELFISLHCDAMEGREAHGATIYTLSQNASDTVSDRLAQQENRSAAIGGVDLAKSDDTVASTLINLSMRESLNLSNRFAELLVSQFAAQQIGLQELKPHRSAGFAVLKAADMPSVLIEMGYLSDPTDAAALADPKHQRQLAEAITASVDRYFKIGDGRI